MAKILALVALVATIVPTHCVRNVREFDSELQRPGGRHRRRGRGPRPQPTTTPPPEPEPTLPPTPAPTPTPEPEPTLPPVPQPTPQPEPTLPPVPPPTPQPEPTPPPTTAPTPAAPQVFPYDFMECPGGAVLTTQQMTFQTYDAITSSVSSLLTSLSSACTADSCPQADWAGCVLRMAGHDFMDYSSADGSGGADACTDMTDADNNGLLACLSEGEHGVSLKSAYADYCTEVSLADFLVIAAEAVMTVTRSFWTEVEPSAAPIDFRSQFQYGRTTSTTCEFAHGRLPNPENGCSAVETTFINNLGLDWDNSAALMGVHTLGRARIENSGYDGWWSDPEHARLFNNNYYIVMYSKGWEVERAINGNPAKNQWTRLDLGARGGSSKEMMLDTDLCLAYDGPDARGGEWLKASEMDCCAWAGPVNGIDYNQEGYCGAANIPNGAGAQRRQCCSGNRNAEDCGNFRRPGGPAERAVRRFATNDAAWAAAFLRAWSTATTNGFTLQRIRN